MNMNETKSSWNGRALCPQSGMASLLITLITVIVITLIVLGFATISRREQRLTLDQQLSAQAFYAAESAVEDAKRAIEQALATGRPLVNKPDCAADPTNTYPTGPQTILDADNDVSYTCLKVDVNPRSASYDGVGEQSIVVPVKASPQITRLEATWQPTAPPAGTPADCPPGVANSFDPQDRWACGYGVLRADLTPTGGAVSRGGLTANTLTGFFVPTSQPAAAGQLSFNGRGVASTTAAACDTAAYGQCRAVITDLGTLTEFTMRISSLYRVSNLSVTAYAGDDPVSFSGAQAVIDATGKAQDVLRRIQVRLPLKPVPAQPPNYAIQSNHAICKRFSAASGYFNIPGDIINPDTGNAMCVARTDGNPPVPPCVPVHDIVLTMDKSESMRYPLRTGGRTSMEQMKEVARRFVQTTNLSPTTNRVGIVWFNNNAGRGVNLTSDQNVLLGYINAMQPQGGTEYLPALRETVNELNANARPGVPRVVIFISDGSPRDSQDQIRANAATMKAAGVRIYTIGIDNTDPSGTYNEQLLIDISGGGGRYFAAFDEPALQAALEAISIDLRCGQ